MEFGIPTLRMYQMSGGASTKPNQTKPNQDQTFGETMEFQTPNIYEFAKTRPLLSCFCLLQRFLFIRCAVRTGAGNSNASACLEPALIKQQVLNYSMSFLSFYNDHHGRADETLRNFIEEDRWAEADFFARTNPLELKWKAVVPHFYDGVANVKVLPIHVTCKRQPPSSFLKTLHQINSKGFLKVDSVYKRTPLHIACMHAMEPTSVNKLIELCPKAAKVKDALGRLPIHYACKNRKLDSLIGILLKTYPAGAMVKDQQGFLPIHVACRVGQPVDTIRLLISAAPASATKKTKKGSTPYMCAKNMKAAHRDEVMDLLIR